MEAIGFPWWLSSKESAYCPGDAAEAAGPIPPLSEDPVEKEMATHCSILAGKSHGQRSMVGFSPWSHKRVGHDLVTKQQHGNHTCL